MLSTEWQPTLDPSHMRFKTAIHGAFHMHCMHVAHGMSPFLPSNIFGIDQNVRHHHQSETGEAVAVF